MVGVYTFQLSMSDKFLYSSLSLGSSISVSIHSEVQRPNAFTYISLGACKSDQQPGFLLPQGLEYLQLFLLLPVTYNWARCFVPVQMIFSTDQLLFDLFTYDLLPFWHAEFHFSITWKSTLLHTVQIFL